MLLATCFLKKQRTARAQDPDCLPNPSPNEERLLGNGGSVRRSQRRALQQCAGNLSAEESLVLRDTAHRGEEGCLTPHGGPG